MNYNDRLGDYVDVAERIRLFRDKYPDGGLQPANPAEPFRVVEIGAQTFIVYVAAAFRHPDDTIPGIGCAWEPFPGKTPYTRDSELQNAESSAWGRAIVATLAADTKKIASLDEVRARRDARTPSDASGRPESREPHPAGTNTVRPATEAQKTTIGRMAVERGYQLTKELGDLTAAEASELIDVLKRMPKVTKPTHHADEEEPF